MGEGQRAWKEQGKEGAGRGPSSGRTAAEAGCQSQHPFQPRLTQPALDLARTPRGPVTL